MILYLLAQAMMFAGGPEAAAMLPARRDYYLKRRQAEINTLHGKGVALGPALAAVTQADRPHGS